jgi:hypothetical protein
VGARLLTEVRPLAVDRETQTRAAKPSAHWLGAIARANR